MSRVSDIVSKTRSGFNNLTRHVAFTVGIDATCLVSTFQLSSTHMGIVGGNVPNYFISISDDSDPEKVKNKLKQCLDGAYGAPAANVKVAVICSKMYLRICAHTMLSQQIIRR